MDTRSSPQAKCIGSMGKPKWGSMEPLEPTYIRHCVHQDISYMYEFRPSVVGAISAFQNASIFWLHPI